MSDYEKKIERAIKLLRAIPQDTEIELAYSTGKDSDVILQLAKEAGIPFRAIYRNTTIDPPGSIKHAKEMGVEIIQPKRKFIDIIQHNGMPSRFMRHCCGYLKEYKILDRSIIGVRRAESGKRAQRYKEPEVCRVYNKNSKAIQYLPILDWTNEDVKRFLLERGITCHPHYYDSEGNFHVERRVGCMGCPLMSANQRIEFFKQYPKMLKLWIRNAQIWYNNHPNNKTAQRFNGNPCNQMIQQLFYEGRLVEYQRVIGGGDFR